jgi:drug/metabolite transporter (DMT)-like permease
MLFCYISVLYIPSGWLAVIFGLAPLITSIMAGLMLGKEHVTLQKIGSLLICLFGLSFIYYQGLDMGASVYLGFMYALLGVLGYSISLVAVKSINAHISPVATMTGTLVICGTTFTLACLYLAEGFPESVPARSAWSIIYLGTIGSVLGFVLFYYLLQKIDATRVALINLITPVSALLLGNLLNDEPLTGKIMIGGLFVLLGLLLFQFSAAIRTWISTIPGRINTTE